MRRRLVGWLDLALDLRLCVNLIIDPATGNLVPTFGTVQPQDVSLTLVENQYGVDEAGVLSFFGALVIPVVNNSLATSIGDIPLPQGSGFGIEATEIAFGPASGKPLTVFLDIVQ